MLSEETLLMSWQRSAIKEVNYWVLNFLSFKFQKKNSKPTKVLKERKIIGTCCCDKKKLKCMNLLKSKHTPCWKKVWLSNLNNPKYNLGIFKEKKTQCVLCTNVFLHHEEKPKPKFLFSLAFVYVQKLRSTWKVDLHIFSLASLVKKNHKATFLVKIPMWQIVTPFCFQHESINSEF